MQIQLGLGGSCHWCTEGIFASVKGVTAVKQGWIASQAPHEEFSEAILITYNPTIVTLDTLVAIHLHTHSCTVAHSFRVKYRSAFYFTHEAQRTTLIKAIQEVQPEFEKPVITQVLPYVKFKLNEADLLDYYYKNPEKPFCRNYITPKLKLLLKRFESSIDQEKTRHI